MTPAEHIEEICKQVNQELEKLIPNTKTLPMEVSSRVLYSRKIGPIEIGYENEYMNGDFDNIIEQYKNEIYNKFHNHLVSLGLRPNESFEEYMGPQFLSEPKPEYEKLLEQVESYTKDIERLKYRYGKDLSSMPEIIKVAELDRLQQHITDIWDCINKKEYQITKEDKKYAKEYTKKAHAYWDMCIE
jgi:hypothetical protein